MITFHRIRFSDSSSMTEIQDAGVDLVVTSPPYPMVGMWDGMFSEHNPEIRSALKEGDGLKAFRLMHRSLNGVWEEVYRVLPEGGIACINIGDSTRTIGGSFSIYPNHAQILMDFLRLGFSPLPSIVWRKQTNSPNKFMGSGMLPPGAYVTLEHEHILVFRKGGKRPFLSETEKENRRASSFFWEERNQWFSDVWVDLKGVGQKMSKKETRGRSRAFPFDLPYRLINMFSVKGDIVLDPFLGTGTTTLAAMAAGRDSVGYEIDEGLGTTIAEQVEGIKTIANRKLNERLSRHAAFVKDRTERKGEPKYVNENYGFRVMTRQETKLELNPISEVRGLGKSDFEVVSGSLWCT